MVIFTVWAKHSTSQWSFIPSNESELPGKPSQCLDAEQTKVNASQEKLATAEIFIAIFSHFFPWEI